MIPRLLAGVTCLTICLGTGISQEKDTSPNQQVKELIEKYRALPDQKKAGPEGADIIKKLKALPAGNLSPQSRDAIARLEATHNLRQISLALHNYHNAKEKFKEGQLPTVDPNWLSKLLPYIEQGEPRRQWEYKVLSEVDVWKLGKNKTLTA